MKPRSYMMTLLARLEHFAPPAAGCHHAITKVQYGSDAVGWEDKLAVSLSIPQSQDWQVFFIDAEDEDKSPEQVADEILKLIKTTRRKP